MSPWNSTLKPGKPLAKRSAKKVQLDKAFSEVRAQVLARDGGCQLPRIMARFAEVCENLRVSAHTCSGPLDPHHIVTVARDRTQFLVPENIITLCRGGHDWAHTHPAEATALGLLRSGSAEGEEQ